MYPLTFLCGHLEFDGFLLLIQYHKTAEYILRTKILKITTMKTVKNLFLPAPEDVMEFDPIKLPLHLADFLAVRLHFLVPAN